MALIKASSQLHLYYPPKFAAICEYSGDDTHLVPKPGALIFDPLVFERKLPLLTTCMTSCSVRCNIRGIRGLIQADGVDYSVGAWQDFCLQSVTVRSFVLAEYYTTDVPFARYACFGSTFAVALFIRSQWPLQNAPGQAADVVRPDSSRVRHYYKPGQPQKWPESHLVFPPLQRPILDSLSGSSRSGSMALLQQPQALAFAQYSALCSSFRRLSNARIRRSSWCG